MAEQELSILIRLKDEATKQLNSFGKTLEANSKQLKNMGLGMMAAGGAIVGTLGLCVKAAADEEKGIIKLSMAMKNAGVQYDDVRESLEKVISVTQKKTAIADDAQREALAALIITTSDYQRSLELLPLAMDIAIAKDMDLKSAAELVGRVNEGNTSILARYGIQLKEGATATEALAELQKKFGGQAEAYGASTAGAFDKIKNSVDDLREVVGKALSPVLEDLINNHLIPIIEKFTAWAEANPALIKQIAALGIALIGAGGLLFALSQIVNMLKVLGISFAAVQASAGWIGMIASAAGAVFLGGKLLGEQIYKWTHPEETPGYTPEPGGPPGPPSLQHGGIVTRPTLAMIGERGPEAVVPLGRGAGATNVYITVQGSVIAERDLAEIVRRELLLLGNRNVNVGLA